jgi:signal transduction histidine kinase/CheY-like chemotaxis protein/ligand-binding sensor domain-containing protein/HPt (histidine-containing phosphotransfer) domain-containing protein
LCAFRLTAFCAVLAAIAPGLCPAAEAETGYPVIQTFSARDIGADVVGWGGGAQDKNGVLYFGSNSLLTYDGDRWRSFPINGSYALRGLDFGAAGELWAAAIGEFGWFGLSNGSWDYHSLRTKLPPDHPEVGNVWETLSWRKGAVFAADHFLLRWDGSSLQSWPFKDGRRVRIFRIGDEIAVHHQPTGLYLLRDNGPELIAPVGLIGTSAIFWLEGTPNELLVLKKEGLYRLAPEVFTAIGGAVEQYFKVHAPRIARTLPDGRLTVATDEGLAVITRDGKVDRVLNAATGLNAGAGNSMLVDRDGAVWLGTMTSFSRVPLAGSSTTFDARSAFPPQRVNKLGRYRGDLVLSNMNGMFRLNAASRQFEPLSGINWYSVDFHVSGAEMFIGGYRGVTRLADGQPTSIYRADSDVLKLSPARGEPGKFFLAEGLTIVELKSDGTHRVVVRGLPDAADSLAEDRRGNLWLATHAHGLFTARLTDGEATARRVDDNTGLSNPRSETRVATLADGTMGAFNRDGAWLLDEASGKFHRISNAPGRAVAAAAPDPATGGLWVIHRSAGKELPLVARISREGGTATWTPHFVPDLNTIGMPRAILAETQGVTTTLWIGGTTSVLRHEFSGPLSAPSPSAPLVRAFARTERDTREAIGVAALPYSTRAVEFEFGVTDFGRRASLRIETKIEGIDAHWMPSGIDARRELTGVRDGHYVVRARTVAETGALSPETSFEFHVLPPWWRTGQGAAGIALAVVLAAYAGYQLRVRTLRLRNAYLEQKVRERTAELERANAAKTEFVANMSHDIRNPLNGIVGLALALEDSRLNLEQREIVATLRECTTYLSTLVDDVLDFASIEARKVELRPGRFAAGDLLQSVVATLKADTAERGAFITTEIDPSLPAHLVGDAGRIQQILVNYVSNALKYAGGHVRLTASQPATSPGEVEFAVCDDGPGISAADQAQLFTKFSRTASARRQEIPGTGLGLASCRMLADLMGGSVAVTSSPDAGARFSLRLPLTIATEPADLAAAALPNTTVLLVEDTDYNAWAATAVLAKLGLSCERARTGRDALRLFSEKRFNVVLLDRNLPDMDGTEVAREIRKLETDGPQAVLLAVTAYCTQEERQLCLDSGMDAFVGKPLTPEKLRRVLIAAGRRLLAAASVQVSPETAELDMSLLHYLADGKTAGLGDQIERFLDTLVNTERELATAARERKYELLRTSAHGLLGQARMVGGNTLAQAAAELETAALEENDAACDELVLRVDVEIRALTAALRHRRAEQPA